MRVIKSKVIYHIIDDVIGVCLCACLECVRGYVRGRGCVRVDGCQICVCAPCGCGCVGGRGCSDVGVGA